MKRVYIYGIIIPIVLTVVMLQSSILKADDWKQRLDALNRPQAGVSNNSLHEPFSDAQSARLRSNFVLMSPLPATSSSIFTVTTTNDTGAGSLRRAINDANASSGIDIIEFNIPGSGYKTISPASPLPYIVDPVVIDATTQPGYALMPLIEIDGINAGDADGLIITAGNTALKGIAVNRFAGYGIRLWIGGGNVVEECYIGLGLDGVTDKGNGSTGLAIFSPNNKIGNPSAGPTVISGNGAFGIRITDTVFTGTRASGNKIQHCFIGTNASLNAAVPNDGSGIVIVNSADDTIGGPGSLNGNVIAGNAYDGIEIFGPQSSRIIVQGNRIGTNGSSAIPNGVHGLLVSPFTEFDGTPSSMLIGGNNPDAMNVISGNGGNGIAFHQDSIGGVGNVIIGNLIGTDITGTVKVPNLLGGIFLQKYSDNSAGVLIGGNSYSDSVNVISGNQQFGIWMRGSGVINNSIRGNYIGTTKLSELGIFALGNQYAGIFLDNTPMNTIGGESPSDGNLIGSNGSEGIAIIGDSATGNSIQNNYIGTSAGDRDLGNEGHGIYIEASKTVVGDVDGKNVIAHNKNRGIFVYSGTRNKIRFNSIYDNDSLGIDFSPQGVTPNDALDTDSGVNNLQNFPLLDSASLSVNSIHIKGRFDSEPNTQYTIDFFKNTNRNASKFGEGETHIGSVTVQCDTGGHNEIDVILPVHVYDYEFITATATDSQGNTSEFSRALCLKDSDGDGILDCWESEGDGIDVNADGIIDYNLWAKGARPNHKDIFVEVDWMDRFRPNDTSMAMVVDAFKKVSNSYVNNPDGMPGINLVIEVSTDTLATSIWDVDPWPEFFDNKKLYFGTIGEREHPNQKNILEAKRLVYRYCIFAHSFNTEGWSGIAEYNNGTAGNDFIVSLGKFRIVGGDKFQQAGTFMHEMGHTLGFGHGGIDDINYKPNYYSVMNYTWQFPKKDGSLSGLTWKLDYSPAALPELVENSLNEAAGLSPQLLDFPSPIFIPFSDTSGRVRTGVLYPNTAVDWDGNGDSSGLASIAVDINNLSNPPFPSPGETLEGFADWQNLKFNFRNSPDFRDPSAAELHKRTTAMNSMPEEMTPEIYDNIQSFPPYGIVPAYRIPHLQPYGADSILVGGNFGNFRIVIGEPAPSGGATFYLKSSDTLIAFVDSMVVIDEGDTKQNFRIKTKGVSTDTSVTISVIRAEVLVSSTIIVKSANIIGFAASTDSGCTVSEQGLFRNKFLSGCTILFKATLDGEAPQAGGELQISSSRPDLMNPNATDSIAGFAKTGFILIKNSATVATPEKVIITATYRGVTRKDSVTLMPAPVYTFTEITPTTDISYSNQMFINNVGDVLIDNDILFQKGSYRKLDSLPGFRLTVVHGMNDIGWLYGSFFDPKLLLFKAAYWKPDTTIILPSPDSLHPAGVVWSINNRGVIVGNVEKSTYPWDSRPVIWQDDSVTYLEGYRDHSLVAWGVNDSGQIVGSAYGQYRDEFESSWRNIGIRWDKGVLKPLFHPWGRGYEIPGVAIASNGTVLLDGKGYFHFATNSVAPGFGPPPPYDGLIPYDMNDSLEVVGGINSETEGSAILPSGFVEKNGYVYDVKCLIDFPGGWNKLMVTGINNDGTIVGVAEDELQKVHLFLLKRSETTDVGEESELKQLPEEFRLSQNYPNPFNPMTKIEYALPVDSRVTLKAFNLLGQEIAVLVSGEQSAGYKSVEFDGGNFASGVYFFRIDATSITDPRRSFSAVKKMLLIK